MRNNDFEARQRAREVYHALTVQPGAWTVIRVDGRSFSRFTEERFDKPFDLRFSELMVTAAQALTVDLGARYAYTESDEISLLFDPAFDLFGRSVEKLVSVSAGIATAAFTHAAGEPAHFDSRIWVGVDVGDVVDYFSWRQADAARCALNGWCYWTLRKAGQSRRQATNALQGTTVADKNELLVAIVAFTALGVYRARHSAAREAEYRGLAERATAAATQHAESAQATVTELQGVREDLTAARGELAEVRKRLAGLEKLLSQIG